MTHKAGLSPGVSVPLLIATLAGACVACGRGASAAKGPPTTVLRIGISSGSMSLRDQGSGIRQIVQNATTEMLARVAPDGSMKPLLADSWSSSTDGRSVRIALKNGVRFSDGSPVDAAVVAAILPGRLRESNGAMAEGVTARSLSPTIVELGVPYPSHFWTEALEEPIRKPGSSTIATGPFSPGTVPTELRATDVYYLGRPAIDKIQINPFPSVRSAWAELLRNNIDMLYEVGPEALDSLESSTGVSVFTFIRSYQLNVTLNAAAPTLRSPTVRQALNLAIDRTAIVNRALNGHGLAANGPLRSNHWTGHADPGFPFDPQRAATMLKGRHVAFTCILPIDPMYERVGLEVQRQLAAAGVEMRLKSLPPDELFAIGRSRNYEAILLDTISGPTLLRLYQLWHSAGVLNSVGRGSPKVDAALDEARRATNDEEYRHAAADVQQAFIDDPPAILLAWGQRARAVSKRFLVPPPDADRPDVLATLRLWTKSNDQGFASRN